MKHTLVLPNSLKNKLDTVFNAPIPQLWNSLGVTNTSSAIDVMISKLNSNYPKLNIQSHRFDQEANIKDKIENTGNHSKFAGYIEDKYRNILGLFFYIDPISSSGNDLNTRNIWPTLQGIHKGNFNYKKSKYYNSSPVFIVNLNITSRITQDAFKKIVICHLLLGFNYIDIFNRSYLDVIPNNGALDSLRNLSNFDKFISSNGSNNLFYINDITKTVTLYPGNINTSTNPTADLYRYLPRILPICYMAENCNYQIDSVHLNSNVFDDLNNFFDKLKE